jgi:cold shock CspA family protein
MTDRTELSAGRVLNWNSEDGHGVLTSPDVAGQILAHYAMIRDQTGWRGLTVGQQVWFSWEQVRQDDCPNRAIDIFTTDTSSTSSASSASGNSAYVSSLDIAYDEE